MLLLPGCGGYGTSKPTGQPEPAIAGYFEPLKKSYVLYEPILVRMVVTNRGAKDFAFETGGDYRSAGGRHERFTVFLGTPDEEPLYLDTGNGLLGYATVPAGGTHEEQLFLNPWSPQFTQPGEYTVTCRRVLSRREDLRTKLLTDCMEHYPIDITRPDARKVLLERMTSRNRGREGFTDQQRAREIERVVGAFLELPQVQTRFTIEILPEDDNRLIEIVSALKDDVGTESWPTRWYLLYLAEALGVPVTKTVLISGQKGTATRDFEELRDDILGVLRTRAASRQAYDPAHRRIRRQGT